jgi:hypothetical protein
VEDDTNTIFGKTVNQVWIDDYADGGYYAMDSLTDKLNANKAEKMKQSALDDLFSVEEKIPVGHMRTTSTGDLEVWVGHKWITA